jgi:hypothetical protein
MWWHLTVAWDRRRRRGRRKRVRSRSCRVIVSGQAFRKRARTSDRTFNSGLRRVTCRSRVQASVGSGLIEQPDTTSLSNPAYDTLGNPVPGCRRYMPLSAHLMPVQPELLWQSRQSCRRCRLRTPGRTHRTDWLMVTSRARRDRFVSFVSAITASKSVRACGWREDAQLVAVASSAEPAAQSKSTSRRRPAVSSVRLFGCVGRGTIARPCG